MLVKLFFKQWQSKIKSLSPARRIFLSFALVILVGSLLLSLPFVQQASSKAGYIDHLFKAVPDGLSVLVAELLTAFHKEETDKGQDPQATNLNQ